MRRIAALTGVAVLSGALSLAQDTEPGWAFVPDVDKEVYFRQPDRGLQRGRLAITGTFIPSPYNPYTVDPPIPGHWQFGVNDPSQDPRRRPYEQSEEVYEYRLGALIRGRLNFPGLFLPAAGEKVLWIDDYRPGEQVPRIYNLPGSLVRVPRGQPRKRFVALIPNPDADWTRDGVTLFPFPKDTHTFREDTERMVGLFREKTVYAGRLMSGGDFVPLPDIRPVPYAEKATAVVRLADGKDATIPVINHPSYPDEFVCERRGHVLVRGRLRDNGTFDASWFTPTVWWGQYFTDRLHAKEDSRIYNLPGSIVPIPKR